MSGAKKIGQITWITYHNFGTFLQAYALQKVLKRLGFDSRIIDDRRFTNYILPRRLWLIKILGLLIHPMRNYNWFRARYKQFAPFNRFKRKYLRIDTNWSDYSSLNNRYDVFICGSDQIWSPLLPEQHGGFYFASFSDNNKVAYAPSLGCKEIPESLRPQFKEWLNGFSAISMREKSASNAIAELIGCDVPTSCDPTLMLTAEDWRDVSRRKNIRRPYLLAYFLTYNESYLRFTKRVANVSGLSLIAIGDDSRVREISDTMVNNIGPDDFIGLIEFADKVVTDSFHGTIFSIIFNKSFATFKRFKESDSRSQNSRIENLFNQLGIDGFYSEKDADADAVDFNKNHAAINDRLLSVRARSIDILREGLNCL